MLLANIFDFSLPLKHPVLLFSLILFIILFAPIILNKVKIPHLIGLIIAGSVIGPNGFNLMLRDSSIILFGTVGLLYIMFLAGLDINRADFKRNQGKSIVFGLYTFLVPMTLGILAGLYILHFSLITSVLLASMFASHTLIAYPIIGKLGITKNRAVNITVGGTMITDTLALLVLSVIAGITNGELSQGFFLKLSISVLIFGLVVLFVFPIIGRWFFKKYEDNISQYIFVLAMIYLSAFLAEAAGIEAIIGAFLAGLALNPLIPHTSPLMNRLNFVGNALFIPIFLIGVGMLIDYSIFFNDYETIKVAITMTVVATTAKYLAAWLTQKTFSFSVDERRVIFGLSNAQAAATLAAVVIGYQLQIFNESVLNGTIIMILFTCTHASFSTLKGAQNISIAENVDLEPISIENEEKILIPVSNIENTDELVNLCMTVKTKSNKKGIFALNVIDRNSSNQASDKNARRILDLASTTAASTDNHLHELIRYDNNIINGITSVVKEHQITDLIMGIHHKTGVTDSFLGSLAEGIIALSNTTTLIYKPTQPLSTINRHIIVVPAHAEKEIGFPFWIFKTWNIASNNGSKLIFYAPKETIDYIKDLQAKYPIECEFVEFDDWNDFSIFKYRVKENDCLMVVLSRKECLSFNSCMPDILKYLDDNFKEYSYIFVYPKQYELTGYKDMDIKNLAVMEPLMDKIERLEEIGKIFTNLFKRK